MESIFSFRLHVGSQIKLASLDLNGRELYPLAADLPLLMDNPDLFKGCKLGPNSCGQIYSNTYVFKGGLERWLSSQNTGSSSKRHRFKP